MTLQNPSAEIFIPDGAPLEAALNRTTHLGISAHQDDLEIMAYDGILKCFGQTDAWFMGVVVTNGSGSPRNGLYAAYTDEAMQQVRKMEQKKAAYAGEYGAAVLLDYPSAAVKTPGAPAVKEDLKTLIAAAQPQFIYTHNLADKHDTHVGVAIHTLQALRELPAELRPDKLYGCEVWRNLDWMCDEDKVQFDVAAHPNLAASLLGVFDSQICGGKRYDLATIGRRTANATYAATHGTDETSALIFAMDLTPLITDTNQSITNYVQAYLDRFKWDVADRIEKFL